MTEAPMTETPMPEEEAAQFILAHLRTAIAERMCWIKDYEAARVLDLAAHMTEERLKLAAQAALIELIHDDTFP